MSIICKIQAFMIKRVPVPVMGRSLILKVTECYSIWSQLDQNIHLSIGLVTIKAGMVVERVFDWFLVNTVAFDFKINSRGSGKQSIAVLSDLPDKRCCSRRAAMFSVMLGARKYVSFRISDLLVIEIRHRRYL